MKSYGGLWDKITSCENILAAWNRVRRNHSHSDEILSFSVELESNLLSLRKSLSEGTYQPGRYSQFKIWDPKPRIISCASVRDRIVHHALMDVLSPMIERTFVDSSFACRKGMGSHKACCRVQELMRRHSYCLKLDVHHFFDNIDHDLLKKLLGRIFRERNVVNLANLIIDSNEVTPGKGLPVGNLTSQWFANLYLSELDHLLNEKCKVHFVRYMDDIAVFADSKEHCWRTYGFVRDYVEIKRLLKLKESVTRVAPVCEGLPFLGLNIYPGSWRLQHGRLHRSRRLQRMREREFIKGDISWRSFESSIRSIVGGAVWYGFRNVLCTKQEDLILATEERAASGSNRCNRGGSWNNDASNCTSSYRNNNSPSNTNKNLGFRLFSTLDYGHCPIPGGQSPMLSEQTTPRSCRLVSEETCPKSARPISQMELGI